MKKIILILISFNFFAQTNSKFVYSITPVDNKGSKFEEMMLTINPNYKNLLKDIEFNLIVNDSISLFEINSKTVPDDSAVSLFIVMTDYTGKIVQTKDSIISEKKFDYLDKVYNIKDTLNKNWQITNETKDIMGYLCYKAISEKITVNPAGKFKNEIIAWFCPKIPFNFGPLSYGSLPGIIFELQTKNSLFGIKKININTQDKIEIKFEKNSFITEENLNKIVLKSREIRRALMDKD